MKLWGFPMSSFWVGVIIFVIIGHVIWAIAYAVRVLKNDAVQIAHHAEKSEDIEQKKDGKSDF